MNSLNTNNLEIISTELRIQVVKMLKEAKSGHLAGSLGLADVFTALYFDVMQHNPHQPNAESNDFLLVSNGHVAPIWYAALAKTGYFPEPELSKLRKIDSFLEGHPDRTSVPGVYNSSGPLAHGLGQALGVAIGLKNDNKNNTVYCIMSDGEQQEGAIWEAIIAGAKYKLDNLICILDNNKIQIDGFIKDIMPLPGNMQPIYTSAGWEVLVIDGNDIPTIIATLNKLKKSTNDKPKLIIANTIPGKGVSFAENDYKYHDWRHDEQKIQLALSELEEKLSNILSKGNQ